MFELIFPELTREETEQYLRRISWDKNIEVTKEVLDELIICHQCAVPFENLEIYPRYKRLLLDKEALFDKIVTRNRGGFCYELNGAFMLLLRALGFDAYSIMCRVAKDDGQLGSLYHRASIVELGGKKYYCDVGFGGAMAPFAVELTEKVQTKHGMSFRIISQGRGWHVLEYMKEKATPTIIFGEQAFLPKDFQAHCDELVSDSNSKFRMGRIVNLHTENGYKGINGDVYTFAENNFSVKREITSDNELKTLLKDEFNIVE